MVRDRLRLAAHRKGDGGALTVAGRRADVLGR
jgi:hypothetical protein